MEVWPPREQLDRMYQTYLALCRRTRKVLVITEQIVVGVYLRYLPEELGAQVRDLASDADLETLYAAAKFAAARQDRCTTHPLLRDARSLPLPGVDATGLLMISGGAAESSDPALAAKGARTPFAPSDREAHRFGVGFHGDSVGQAGPDRRREGFPDRRARPTMPPRVPSRSQPRRPQFGFGDAQGRDQGPPMPRSRAADRRYSADPRPARWPPVHVANVQSASPELPRPMGPSYQPAMSRRTFDPPSTTGASG